MYYVTLFLALYPIQLDERKKRERKQQTSFSFAESMIMCQEKNPKKQLKIYFKRRKFMKAVVSNLIHQKINSFLCR